MVFIFCFIFNDPFWIVDKPFSFLNIFFNSRYLQNNTITQLTGNVFSGLKNLWRLKFISPKNKIVENSSLYTLPHLLFSLIFFLCLFVCLFFFSIFFYVLSILNSWIREAEKRVSCGDSDMEMYHSLTHSLTQVYTLFAISRPQRNCPNPTPCTACLLYTSPSPRDLSTSRMPSSA